MDFYDTEVPSVEHPNIDVTSPDTDDDTLMPDRDTTPTPTADNNPTESPITRHQTPSMNSTHTNITTDNDTDDSQHNHDAIMQPQLQP